MCFKRGGGIIVKCRECLFVVLMFLQGIRPRSFMMFPGSMPPGAMGGWDGMGPGGDAGISSNPYQARKGLKAGLARGRGRISKFGKIYQNIYEIYTKYIQFI